MGARGTTLEKASDEAAGTRWAPLWNALAAGTHPAPEVWNELASLEPYRAARLIFDCELLLPGIVPPYRVREAIATLRRCNAGAIAEKLESQSLSPWRALDHYLAKAPRREANDTSDIDRSDIEKLFTNLGYSNIRLVWIQDQQEKILIPGIGGDEHLSCRIPDGSQLLLKAPRVDNVLKTLLTLIRRDLRRRVGSPHTKTALGAAG